MGSMRPSPSKNRKDADRFAVGGLIRPDAARRRAGSPADRKGRKRAIGVGFDTVRRLPTADPVLLADPGHTDKLPRGGIGELLARLDDPHRCLMGWQHGPICERAGRASQSVQTYIPYVRR